MIMVDIYFPAVDTTCNVRVDEHSKISALIKEIGEMMCKKYKSTFDDTKESYLLCSLDDGQILDTGRTLFSYGLKNGGRLMLV